MINQPYPAEPLKSTIHKLKKLYTAKNHLAQLAPHTIPLQATKDYCTCNNPKRSIKEAEKSAADQSQNLVQKNQLTQLFFTGLFGKPLAEKLRFSQVPQGVPAQPLNAAFKD